MKDKLTFNDAKKMYFKTIGQYIPVVSRVHGGKHPEFHEVRDLFDIIGKKAREAGQKKPDLDREFARLREITSNYMVPGDVCESYEAVYKMLAEIDEAYRASEQA